MLDGGTEQFDYHPAIVPGSLYSSDSGAGADPVPSAGLDVLGFCALSPDADAGSDALDSDTSSAGSGELASATLSVDSAGSTGSMGSDALDFADRAAGTLTVSRVC